VRVHQYDFIKWLCRHGERCKSLLLSGVGEADRMECASLQVHSTVVCKFRLTFDDRANLPTVADFSWDYRKCMQAASKDGRCATTAAAGF
jgi:hypothetical protein